MHSLVSVSGWEHTGSWNGAVASGLVHMPTVGMQGAATGQTECLIPAGESQMVCMYS